MIPVTVEQLADVVGGALRRGDPGATITDVVIDSRRVERGALFVALPGERTDGHRHVPAAAAAGAAACLVAEGVDLDEVPPGTALVAVDDPADALLGLGRWVRETVAPVVVAVTGSAGKTTTKDLAAAAVGAGRAVVANPGSFNNDLGVPLTCCALTLQTEVLVAEVGARGLGHIAALAGWLAPDVAIVTTVSGAHLELFGDVDAVARAKAELVTALGPDGLAVLNADDPRVAAMAAAAPGRVTTYGRGPADWRAEDVALDGMARARFTVRGVPVALRLPGAHHVGNALAALVAADAVGVPLAVAATAVNRATVSRWRTELVETVGGVTVLNDAYNANPASTAAALETLAEMRVPGRRWAVLGRMAELGAVATAEHERVGTLAAGLGLDGVIAVGDEAAGILRGVRAGGGMGVTAAVADTGAALARLEGTVAPGDAVLVKASRAEGLERLAADLVTRWGGAAGGEGAT